MRTGFGRGFPQHDPWLFDSRRLTASGEIRDKLIDHREFICRYGCPRSPAGVGDKKRLPLQCVLPKRITPDFRGGERERLRDQAR